MTEKKTNLKKLQGTKTKTKLYKSAQKLFTTKDFAAVSVEDITRAAGVTKGTFYVHFASKDELIASLIADYTAGIDLEYRNFLDSLPADMPALDMMHALIEKIADVIVDTIGYDVMRTVYQLQLAKTVDTEKVTSYGRALYAMFRELLQRGVLQGEFKTELSLDALSRNFVTAIRGACYEWCVRYPDFDLKAQTSTLCRLLLDGIYVPSA